LTPQSTNQILFATKLLRTSLQVNTEAFYSHYIYESKIFKIITKHILIFYAVEH